MHALIRRIVRPTALAAMILAGPIARAETPPAPKADLLDETRRMQEIAGRQVEAEVRLALSEANTLSETEPSKAAERLNAALKKLETNDTLDEERKAKLIRVVRDRIRMADAAAATTEESVAERKAREAIDKLQKVKSDRDTAEREQIKAGIKNANDLHKDGKHAEAAQAAKELLKQHPDDISVQILNGVSSTASKIQDDKDVHKDRDDRRVAALLDLDRSMAAPLSDVEYPKNWREMSARRLKSQQLSPAEMQIMQALTRPISVEFKGSRLQDVVDYVSTMTGMTLMIDKPALDENQLSYDTPITFAVKTKLATRTALRGMLNQLGLTYVVRDNVIQITSLPRARDMMVTKSYYIGDVVAVSGAFGGSTQYGLALDQAQLGQNVAGVVEMITSTIDPMSWQGKGGTGTIGFNTPTMSLIVRQSAEVHMMIRGGLYK